MKLLVMLHVGSNSYAAEATSSAELGPPLHVMQNFIRVRNPAPISIQITKPQ